MTHDPLGGLVEPPPSRPAPAPEPERAAAPLPRMSTIVLLGILVAFFIAEGVVSRDAAVDDGWTLFRLGALYAPAFQAGDWWRLGSYAFLHIGWVHIAMNGMALWALMPQIEATYGPNLAIGLFSSTALAAGATSLLWALHSGHAAVVAGASGGIFGLFGATVALFWRLRERIPEQARRHIVRGIVANILFNAIIAFSGYVDNAAHLGGFASGVLFGLAAPLLREDRRAWHKPVYYALLATALGLFALEGAAVAWAVRPKPRVLRGDGVTAQIPGMLVPLAPGAAGLPGYLRLTIAKNTEPPEGTPVLIGQHTWSKLRTEQEGVEVTVLSDDALAILLECGPERCRGASGDALIEGVAATARPAP